MVREEEREVFREGNGERARDRLIDRERERERERDERVWLY